MPLAHHYTVTVEQQLARSAVLSVAYVGTIGRHLLRFTTPNLGPSSTLVPGAFTVFQELVPVPEAIGRVLPPARPVSGVGAINRFETTATSRYDSLQLQVRGRFHGYLQYQGAYTLSKALDDVSDVFELAGAPSLPQDSRTFSGERGLASFDTRHRVSYQLIYEVPKPPSRFRALGFLANGLQIASTGTFSSGPPFTVNSIFDVNLDGNLTDRLNTTNGLIITGDRSQPLRLTVDPITLLAPVGQDGAVGRNTFHAGSIFAMDVAISKRINFSQAKSLIWRTDVFNITNRTNFSIPDRFLEAPGFGRSTSSVTPGRRIQFSLKFVF
jgi:hypothetical protein